MDTRIQEIAQRLRGLREWMDVSTAEMADIVGSSEADYIAHENGEKDFSFTFLYQCAERFGVDIVELLTGDSPKLNAYTVVRKDKGLPIKRRQGFTYQHLAYLFKNKLAEPFLVTAPYIAEEQDKPIALSTHDGQEFDYVLEGQLKVVVDGHTEVLSAGDAIHYNSSKGHGMIATGGDACKFLAVVIKGKRGDA